MSTPTKFLIPSEHFIPFNQWLKENAYVVTEEKLYTYWLEFIEYRKTLIPNNQTH